MYISFFETFDNLCTISTTSVKENFINNFPICFVITGSIICFVLLFFPSITTTNSPLRLFVSSQILSNIVSTPPLNTFSFFFVISLQTEIDLSKSIFINSFKKKINLLPDIKKTAVDVRFMPMMNVGKNINVNLFGIGLKHDLLQWIPVVGDAIPMSLSIQGGYTTLNTELEIADQKVALKTKATTINLVASRKILMITGYAGVGYNSSSTTFLADANFDLGGVEFEEEVAMNFTSNNNLRANVGLRLNITLITIQADYTFAEYPTATVGLGVSLR